MVFSRSQLFRECGGTIIASDDHRGSYMLVNSKRLQSAAILTHTWRFYFLQVARLVGAGSMSCSCQSVGPHIRSSRNTLAGNKLADFTCSTIYRTPIFTSQSGFYSEEDKEVLWPVGMQRFSRSPRRVTSLHA